MASPERVAYLPRVAWPDKAGSLARSALEILVPVLVAALVAVVVATLAPSRGYRYRASSAQPGYQARGWSGLVNEEGIFVHTKKQKDPWVEIVPGKKPIHRVTVQNRRKSRDRAIPLVLEVAEGKDGFREVGRMTESFVETTFTFPAVSVRKIRLRVDDKKTYLHLRRVSID